MISYAQNFEDVILRRVFRDKKEGFYIDIGAMDPVVESVTKFFYDEGWSGVNVEPNEFFFEKLMAERVRDINLNLAVGEHEQIRTLYASNETGLSTLEKEHRDAFVARGFEARETTVRVTTLAAICREHANRPIDFLKVDCEGWEKQVLKSGDWDRFRPTVVIVEATLPGVQAPAWSDWEPFLRDKAYEIVYFDGLNRFYLSRESLVERRHFNTPPNVFDEFKVYATEAAERSRLALQKERNQLLEERDKILADQTRKTVERDQVIGERDQVIAERDKFAELLRTAEREIISSRQISDSKLELQSRQIAELEREHRELRERLLKSRLWVGQLSQDLAAIKRGQ